MQWDIDGSAQEVAGEVEKNVSQRSAWRIGLVAGLVLAVVGVVAYHNSLSGPFIFDDETAIVKNDSIRQLWPPWVLLYAPCGSAEGRPVGNLSLAINYAIGGLDVRGYHVVNIIVHILCALVLFGIVRRTLLCEKLRGRFGKASGGIALASALVWMVHPIQTECVDYVTQRFESMMGLFYLLTLYCAIRAIDSERRSWWCGASVLACALGMGTKEVMVTAPLMVLLYDVVFLSGSIRQTLRERRGLYTGLAATWIVLVALMWLFPSSETEGFGLGLGASDYVMNQCIVLVDYLRLTVWPDRLLLDYGPAKHLAVGEVAPYAALLGAMAVITVIVFFYRPMVGFLGVWFFVILVPTSSFVPLVTEVGAERRMYLPLAGLVVLLVMAVYVLLELVGKQLRANEGTGKGRVRFEDWVGGFLVIAVVAGLTWRTVLRNEDYRSEVSIWQTVVDILPESFRGHSYLGNALLNQGRFDEAISHYRTAVELRPNDSGVYNNIGVAFQSQGKLDEAIDYYRQALEIDPNNARAHNNLGNVFQSQGKLGEAIRHYRLSMKIEPNNAEVYNNLGIVLVVTGQLDEALKYLREAVRLNPNFPAPLTAMAVVLVGHPDAKVRNVSEAIRLAERAAELTKHQHVVTLKTLAAAYAAAGQLERAVVTAEAALKLAYAAKNDKLADAIRKQLEVYRQAKP